jgi:N-acetylglucosamine kinase-like BadF-type ATPase
VHVMGIDGGGSTVRVLITDPSLNICGRAQDTGVNPKLVGDQVSAQRVQAAIRRALTEAALPASDIAAVCIGLAGGGTEWNQGVVKAVIPSARVICAADLKIALVGARGQCLGVVVLAGTGCGAFGINAAGEELFVGGYGYLLDDVGSGYWIGKEAVRHCLRAFDDTGPPTRLTGAILTALTIDSRAELVQWMYAAVKDNASAVAQLAPLVLNEAVTGDAVALAIVEQGAQELALLCHTVMRRLGGFAHDQIAFAGGLLTAANQLSHRLSELLGLPEIPAPRYPPVMGAAILALQAVGEFN